MLLSSDLSRTICVEEKYHERGNTMATHSTRPPPVLQALQFVLACLGGDRSRRRWLANWLELPPPRFLVIVKRKQPIPMRDGRVLLADFYLPKTRETWPTILIRSPWGRGWDKPPFSLVYMFIAQRFAEQGYHVVVQSTGTLSCETNHRSALKHIATLLIWSVDGMIFFCELCSPIMQP
jgi:predicted acyl esterase